MDSIKKVSRFISDINHPKQGNKTPVVQKQAFFKRGSWGRKEGFKTSRTSSLEKFLSIIKFAFIGLIAFAVLYFAYLFISKNALIASARVVYENLRLAAKGIVELNTEAVPTFLDNADKKLKHLELKTAPLGVAPVLDAIPLAIADIKNISSSIGKVAGNISELKSNGFNLIFKDGERFVNILQNLVSDLSNVETSANNLRNSAARFNVFSKEADNEYLSFKTDLQRSIEAIQSIINIIDRAGENHFLILFENPTEIRPGGGFVGSYGDVIIQSGAINSIEANDIYYPEHFSNYRIVPPIQLQGITTKWGPQDANWFFDFRVSAKKIIEFIEESSVYKDKAIKFDGVAAINVRMIEEILKVTGPIDIPEYKLTLTNDNFLSEIQREVETGPDKKPGQNPKRVLKYITPALLQKLGALNEEDKDIVFNILVKSFHKKDMRFYFKDPVLENLIIKYGGGGDVYDLPLDFQGDYLAVVNANIGGGKSDKFIAQKIELKSKIDPLGLVADNLIITRVHSGQNEKDWWYRSTNHNYIKVFVPPASKLERVKGNSIKNILPSIDYKKSGYKIDPDLNFIEETKEL